jgi:hypothetical protein
MSHERYGAPTVLIHRYRSESCKAARHRHPRRWSRCSLLASAGCGFDSSIASRNRNRTGCVNHVVCFRATLMGRPRDRAHRTVLLQAVLDGAPPPVPPSPPGPELVDYYCDAGDFPPESLRVVEIPVASAPAKPGLSMRS